MVMIRRATGRIENVAEQQDTKEGVIVCKACSHIVFRVNLNDNKNCPFCHRNAFATLEKPILEGNDEDDDDGVIAVKC